MFDRDCRKVGVRCQIAGNACVFDELKHNIAMPFARRQDLNARLIEP